MRLIAISHRTITCRESITKLPLSAPPRPSSVTSAALNDTVGPPPDFTHSDSNDTTEWKDCCLPNIDYLFYYSIIAFTNDHRLINVCLTSLVLFSLAALHAEFSQHNLSAAFTALGL